MMQITGEVVEVVEVGTIDTDMFAPGFTIRREDGTFVTVLGLTEDETRELVKHLYRGKLAINFAGDSHE